MLSVHFAPNAQLFTFNHLAGRRDVGLREGDREVSASELDAAVPLA